MSKLGDIPAFPTIELCDSTTHEITSFASQGMTLRQFYAGLAMQAILSNEETMRQGVALTKDMPNHNALPMMNGLLACEYADALIAALERNRV